MEEAPPCSYVPQKYFMPVNQFCTSPANSKDPVGVGTILSLEELKGSFCFCDALKRSCLSYLRVTFGLSQLFTRL